MEWMSRLMPVAAEFSALAGRDKEARQFLEGLAIVAREINLASSSYLFLLIHEREESVMNESISAEMPSALFLAAGADRFGEQRGLGMSTIAFKVTTPNSSDLFILENAFWAKGGPARHLHYDQEEWFYVLEGEFLFEVGAERFRLQPGDSLLAPRQVSHVWAFVGEGQGRVLVVFLPAGNMEAFFREVTRANAMPAQDPALWRAHSMELLGPPLPVE